VSQPPPNGQPAQSDHADQETVQSQLELESTILWQGPALALAAQAFLLTIALGPDVTSFARVISAGLALVTAASALYLVHRKGGEVQDWKNVARIKESRSGPLASSVWKVALAVFATADLAIVIMAWSGRPHCWLPAC
jgi:hypothetical protein